MKKGQMIIAEYDNTTYLLLYERQGIFSRRNSVFFALGLTKRFIGYLSLDVRSFTKRVEVNNDAIKYIYKGKIDRLLRYAIKYCKKQGKPDGQKFYEKMRRHNEGICLWYFKERICPTFLYVGLWAIFLYSFCYYPLK